MRRIGSVCLLLGLLCLLAALPARAERTEAMPSLNRTSVTLLTKRTFKLQVRHTAEQPLWRSSNPSVAIVDEQGLVTARRPGKCRIIALCASRRFVCRVKVTRFSRDSLRKNTPPVDKNQHKILLFGSSSMMNWSSSVYSFAPYHVINMGIGGSWVYDWMAWYKELIVPYRPSAIVMYCGINDIARGVPGEENARRTIRLLKRLHRALPGVPICYISLLHSWARKPIWEAVELSNQKMEAFCGRQGFAHYVDIYPLFLKENGKPDRRLFRDRVHVNAAGYEIWDSVIPEAVKNTLEYIS